MVSQTWPWSELSGMTCVAARPAMHMVPLAMLLIQCSTALAFDVQVDRSTFTICQRSSSLMLASGLGVHHHIADSLLWHSLLEG